MKINNTTSALISTVLDHLHMAFAYEGGMKGYVYANLDSICVTLQTINDFDLEGMIDVALYTRWLGSDDDAFDAFLIDFKSFIFNVTGCAYNHTNGDIAMAIHHVFNSIEGDDTDNQTDNNSDLINDEVYGDVDPEQVEHLKMCFQL